MAEMIATYRQPRQRRAGHGPRRRRRSSPASAERIPNTQRRARPASNGSGYLNEVSSRCPERRPQRPSRRTDVARMMMSAYRFCRTDDIALLVDALNRCWSPYFPDEPPMTPAAFKRSIRDLQVWCSSCMVAFSGSDPIGVLIGAKRPSGTLIHKIAVHPDHRATGSWPSPAHLAQLEARDSRPPPNHRRSPRDARPCLRAVQRKRICPGSAPDGLRLRTATAPQGGQRDTRRARVGGS